MTKEQNQTEILPVGHQWEFSDRNTSLKPKIYNQERRDLSQADEAVQRLIRGLQETFIQKDWHFVSIVGNNRGFAVVFSNPWRGAITSVCPPPDFIKPEALIGNPQMAGENVWELSTEPINKFLVGTNLYAYNAHGAYNRYVIGEKRPFTKEPKLSVYYQTGVAYIHANLWTIQEKVGSIDTQIEEITEEMEERQRQSQTVLTQLQSQRSQLLSQQTLEPKRFLNS